MYLYSLVVVLVDVLLCPGRQFHSNSEVFVSQLFLIYSNNNCLHLNREV